MQTGSGPRILLEGRPGVGKTTLLCALARRLSAAGIGGFYTKEIREGGRRVGFRVETFGGQSGILAHIGFKKGPAVGSYRVDVETFERIAVKELKRALAAADMILMDEIGRMELFSERFGELVVRCLDSSRTVIATVMSRPHPFVDGLKIRPGVERIVVTESNRNGLVEILARKIADFHG